MIGKQIKGESFRGLLNHLRDKHQARLIGGNMAGQHPRVLAAEFRVARDLNPRLRNPVYYAILSLPEGEVLDDGRWCDIADDYVVGMGFDERNQYLVCRPTECQYDQVHIVACRIRITDGSTVSDSWDYLRSEKLIRELEQKYGLTPFLPTTQKQTSPDDKAPVDEADNHPHNQGDRASTC